VSFLFDGEVRAIFEIPLSDVRLMLVVLSYSLPSHQLRFLSIVRSRRGRRVGRGGERRERTWRRRLEGRPERSKVTQLDHVPYLAQRLFGPTMSGS
jgi:hypothetical protein